MYHSIQKAAADRHKQEKKNEEVCGTQLKIGNDIVFADYLGTKVVDEGYSPEAVLTEIKVQGKAQNFQTSICTTTFYSYIEKGIFLRLTNKELPVKGKRKRKYKKVQRQARNPAGESIERRPEEIESRDTFGHWEMDSVIGKRGGQKYIIATCTAVGNAEQTRLQIG